MSDESPGAFTDLGAVDSAAVRDSGSESESDGYKTADEAGDGKGNIGGGKSDGIGGLHVGFNALDGGEGAETGRNASGSTINPGLIKLALPTGAAAAPAALATSRAPATSRGAARPGSTTSRDLSLNVRVPEGSAGVPIVTTPVRDGSRPTSRRVAAKAQDVLPLIRKCKTLATRVHSLGELCASANAELAGLRKRAAEWDAEKKKMSARIVELERARDAAIKRAASLEASNEGGGGVSVSTAEDSGKQRDGGCRLC